LLIPQRFGRGHHGTPGVNNLDIGDFYWRSALRPGRGYAASKRASVDGVAVAAQRIAVKGAEEAFDIGLRAKEKAATGAAFFLFLPSIIRIPNPA
jgi:hypothetical protein